MWWTLMAVALAADGDGTLLPAADPAAEHDKDPSLAPAPALARPPLDVHAVAARAALVSTARERADAEVKLALAEDRRQRQRLNPQLSLSARYTRLSEEDPTVIDPGIPGFQVSLPAVKPDQWHFGVSAILPVSDWLLRSPAIAEAGRLSVESRTALSEARAREAALQAGLAYWSLVRVARAESVAALTLADAERRLDEVGARLRVDLATRADLLLAESRVAEVKLSREELGHARALIEAQLRALLDLTGEAYLRFDLEPVVAPDPGLRPHDRPTGDLLAEAWRARPEPRALAAAKGALEAQRRLVRADRLPRLDLALNAQLVDPNPRALVQERGLVPTWDASAVLSWKLDGLWQADTSERELDAREAGLAAERRALDDGLRLELESALRQLRDAAARQRTSEALIEAATEGHRARLALYANGSGTATELAEAETQLERARLSRVDAEIGARVAELLLRFSLGAPL